MTNVACTNSRNLIHIRICFGETRFFSNASGGAGPSVAAKSVVDWASPRLPERHVRAGPPGYRRVES